MTQIGLTSHVASRLTPAGVPLKPLLTALLLGVLVTPAWAADVPANVDGKRIIAADDEPGNWMSHGRTYDEQRYSPLEKINDGNVGQLGLAWSYKFELDRGVEDAPIGVDGVIYTDMAIMASVAASCEECEGKRFQG